jgi:hypothetical protein
LLWLNQFDAADRAEALGLVQKKLVFISEEEISHLVKAAAAQRATRCCRKLGGSRHEGVTPRWNLSALSLRMARPSERQDKPTGLGMPDNRQNILQRHIHESICANYIDRGVICPLA